MEALGRVMHMKGFMQFPVSKICSMHVSDYKCEYINVRGLKY